MDEMRHIRNVASRDAVGTMCGLHADSVLCADNGERPTCQRCIAITRRILRR